MPEKQNNLNEQDKVEELGKSFAIHCEYGDKVLITVNGVTVSEFTASKGKLSCYWNSKR